MGSILNCLLLKVFTLFKDMAIERQLKHSVRSVFLLLLFFVDGFNCLSTKDPKIAKPRTTFLNDESYVSPSSESIIRAYWDPQSCGPNGPNYNRNWCQHGSAYRTKMLLDTIIIIDNRECKYNFYAEYT